MVLASYESFSDVLSAAPCAKKVYKGLNFNLRNTNQNSIPFLGSFGLVFSFFSNKTVYEDTSKYDEYKIKV